MYIQNLFTDRKRHTREKKKHVNRNAKAKCEQKTNKITTNYKIVAIHDSSTSTT